MELLEMYFWMIIIICGVLNVPIIVLTEDLKTKKRYKKYLKISFIIGLIGIVILLTDWNYLCGYQCIVYTFSPFITLLICKAVMILSKNITKKEGFQIYRKRQIIGSSKIELSDGIYQKNNGDLKHKRYYSWYTSFISATPFILLLLLLIIIKETTC
ncbi:hypothetical protein [Winogradskyella psychrotolerans]|uniref:hypothetical protein n=1 Tax=Winogradskyella psychrotolerans TaxID=1344585 RepID=UPI001C068798|nr:hypothetical protein [Winogradskyella psychrotolerans]MBU2927831.1 hypothetical protein [Winogradskyella psychrotolerans]